MNVPETSSNSDICAALLQLNEKVESLGEKIDSLDEKIERLDHKLDDKVERLEYEFDIYQKGTDGMVRMATTIIIAAASVLILFNLSPAISKVVTALTSN